MSKLYHFLGSVHFAVSLILSAAFLVILGTFFEAKTGSHLAATEKIYSHPIFLALLILFFINILFSALRRWPFRIKHIPFLITHLGLLMILSGTMIKSLFGLQGTMGLLEGTGKEAVFLNNTQELLIETKEGSHQIPFTKLPTQIGALEVDVVHFAPHSEERTKTWIENGFLYISGLAPIPVKDEIPQPKYDDSWNVFAIRSLHVEETMQTLKKYSYPLIAFIQDPEEHVHLVAVNKEGQTHYEHFPKDQKTIVIYDQGYGGYAVQAEIPFHSKDSHSKTILETPYIPSFALVEPHQKWEENRPLLWLKLSLNDKTEFIALQYDPFGTGLKWAAFQGKYLFRFQPRFVQIPYHVRLRKAKQTLYPNSNQPSGYESDLWITDLRSHVTTEASIRMNQVFETWDGYRFYLANIYPNQETKVKGAQIIINHDPVKYLVTYPGCFMIALGMILLFFIPKKFYLRAQS